MSKAKAAGPRVFVPLTKVDEEQRLVYGVITEEVQDKAGETMDYATSKENFVKWSGGIEKATGGLSKGNVRVMHQLKVAGKLTDISYDDDDKSIEVCAKVVDDEEWNKVLEGCYTGFSVGGSYGKKWTDKETKLKKYTAVPNEVSLVDNPCVHGATFSLVKADGAEEEVLFKSVEEAASSEADPVIEESEQEPVAKADDKSAMEKQAEQAAKANPNGQISNDDLAARCKELQKAADDGRDWMSFMDEARVQLMDELQKASFPNGKEEKKDDKKEADKSKSSKAKDDDEEGDEEGDEDNKSEKSDFTAANRLTQKWITSDGESFEKKADAEAHEKQLLLKAAEGDDEVTKLTKSIGRIKDLLEKKDGDLEVGEELAEPSILSLDRVEDLHKAYLELELPRGEDGAPLLEKGMYTVSRFANMLGDVASLARTIKAEGKLEGNDKVDSEVAKSLVSQLGTFGESFMDYSKQQIAELVAGLDIDLTPRACYDYYYRAVEADPENALAKNVCELIEAVEDEHEAAMEKLAKFASEPVDTQETLQKVADLTEENDKLTKAMAEVLPTVEALEKRLKIVEDTPMPRAPRGNVLGKNQDTGQTEGTKEEQQAAALSAVGEMLKTMSPDQVSTLLIKAAQNNPQKMHFAGR
jgi:hypothetical protein